MIKRAFGQTLRQRRTRKRLTQEQVALESGVSLRYLQDLEAGNKMAAINTVFRLARALDTSPATPLNPAWKAWSAENKC
jgi:transcriptional regulator with XRE-family HTH domain